MIHVVKKIGCSLIPVLFVVSCVSQAPKNRTMIADVDPIPLGSVGIAFDQLFSAALDTKDVPVQFNPRDDTVSLEFRYQTVIYRQYWDRTGREQFIAAVQQYHADFEARNLSTKASKSRTAYGSVNARAEWGQFAFSVNACSYPRMDLGYRFKGNSPYFIVVQREARDTVMPSADDSRMSLQITAYFTRSMADKVAAFFDPAYLERILEAQGIPVETEEEPVSDPYF
ncbi:MAG: hypothetical protein LBB80_03940 [Treponema sp.]|nr:hypothetical protein [Treponema sp.]